MGDRVEVLFVKLSEEVRGLYLSDRVDIIEKPTPLQFYKYVAANKPVIIKGLLQDWLALNKWSKEYLIAKMKDQLVTVAITPDGYADSIVNGPYFAQPLYEQMTLQQFFDRLDAAKNEKREVHYIQLQNNSLNLEFVDLTDDVPKHIPFVTEALGRDPEAVNIWIGEDHSVTSLHKDHYENLYGVISGEKHFILYPPTDHHFLHEAWFRTATYQRDRKGNLELVPISDQEPIPWLPVDPLHPDYDKYPRFKNAKPIKVTVKAGEMLYLPSLYYHHVTQSADGEGKCVAVNYWYDMDFDIKFAYFQFLKALSEKTVQEEEAEQDQN